MRIASTLVVVSCLVLLPACGGRRHRDDGGPPHHHDQGEDRGRGRGDERRPEFASSQERAAERRDDRRDDAVEDRTGWEKLGECVVDGKGDKDKIHVKAREGTFTRVMLVVEHSACELWDVELHFENGEKFSPSTRLVFSQNSRSRVIDLPGAKRDLKKCEFRYGNLPGGGKAQVELWGLDARHDDRDGRDGKPGKPDKPGKHHHHH